MRSSDMFVIPMSDMLHWSLGAVDMKNKKIYYCDGLQREPGSSEAIAFKNAMKSFLQSEWKALLTDVEI